MTDEALKCFRCGAQPKILMNMKFDDSEVKMCPQCFADFGLFMQGHAIDRYVCVERGHYVRKEVDE